MKTMILLLGALAVVLLMTSAGVQLLPAPIPAALVVHVVRVFELERGAGVVVFKTVGGKLTSRCYRA